MTTPTPVTPIDASPSEVEDRLGADTKELPVGLLERIAASGAVVSSDDETRAEAGRDWWPIAIDWAVQGGVPQRPAAVSLASARAAANPGLAWRPFRGEPLTVTYAVVWRAEGRSPLLASAVHAVSRSLTDVR